MRTQRQKTYVSLGGPGQTHLEQEGTGPESHLNHSGEGPSLPLDHSSAWVTCSMAFKRLLTPQSASICQGEGNTTLPG